MILGPDPAGPVPAPAPSAGSGVPSQQRRVASGGESESQRVEVDPDAMLAELAATEGHRPSGLYAAMSSRRNRFLLGAAVMVALIGGFLLVSLVLARLAG